MTQFEELTDLAITEAALFFESRKMAASYAFQVRDFIEEYFVPYEDGTVEISYLEGEHDDVVVKKCSELAKKMVCEDTKKCNQFGCGLRITFKKGSYTAGSTITLDILVAEKQCIVFNETFDIASSKALGECIYKQLKKRYDPALEKPTIGFV